MLAEDSALCFDKNVPQILDKLQGLDPICERIDKLEKFVGKSRENSYVGSYARLEFYCYPF